MTLYELPRGRSSGSSPMEPYRWRRSSRSREGVPPRARTASLPTTPQMEAFLRAGSRPIPMEPPPDVPRAAPSAIPSGPMEQLRRGAAPARTSASRATRGGQAAPGHQALERLVTAEGRVVPSTSASSARSVPALTHTIDAVGHSRLHVARAGLRSARSPNPADWYSVGVMLYEAADGSACRSRARCSRSFGASSSTGRPPPPRWWRRSPRRSTTSRRSLLRRAPDSAPGRGVLAPPAPPGRAGDGSAVRRARAASARCCPPRPSSGAWPSSRAFTTRTPP